jgi:hypothetical protein
MNSSDKKQNGKDDKSNKRRKSSKSFEKYSHKKQGKMNPKEPFSKIVLYETESEYEDDAGSVVSTSDPDVSFIDTSIGIGSTAENVFLACLKNKQILNGVDFVAVMAKSQGKGSKSLKGNDLKRFLTWKECKMIISKLSYSGANLEAMKIFLTSVKIHLSAKSNYVEISSDIVASICKILTNVCFMENVDNGIMSEYFNRRVADLRNRRNYEAK